MTKRLAILFLLSGCAIGPRAVPPMALPGDRLVLTENILTNAKNLSATFEIDGKGESVSHFTGSLELVSGNALHLTADGQLRGEAVQIELDSRDSEGTNRSSTKGPSVNSHRDPPASRLREAVAVSLARLGLLQTLVSLAEDRPVDKSDGGALEWLQPVDPKDGASESVNGEPCRRVDYPIRIGGEIAGDTSVCISDSTALPLQRNVTLRTPRGELTATETYKWQVK
jgi:hypothetical protein